VFCLSVKSMEDDHLVWASPEEVVRLARKAGMTTAEIIRTVSGCLDYRAALEVARDYAPLLDISVSEFMQLRKNE